MQIKLPHNFTYREYQKPQFIASQQGIKRFMKVWHRRAGKDLTDLNFAIMKTMERKGNYWHLLPEYGQARKAIWMGKTKDGMSYLDCFPPELIKRKLEQQMMVELINGSIWQIVGSDNMDAAVGSGPVGVTLSEFSLTQPNAWGLIEPMLLENGGWASFNFTPRGKNHAHKLWELAKKNPEWFTQILTIDDTKDLNGNPIISREMIDKLREMGTEEEVIQQEYYCSFEGSLLGAYYARQLNELQKTGCITKVPYNSAYPVHTYWDIGRSDYTSIWFCQIIGGQFLIIDYLQKNGEELEYYARELRDRGYRYEKHNLPHDAGQLRLGMGGKTVKQQLEALMPKETFRLLRVTQSIQADISATRAFMKRCAFDEAKCEQGLDALKSYTKRYSDVKQCYEDDPVHNWASHGADAFRELAVDNIETYNIPRPTAGTNGLPTFNAAIGMGNSGSGRI